tara:strand:+ start:70 stop:525 length:456 start_codon:yes stop_codon:yes gene_type:complete
VIERKFHTSWADSTMAEGNDSGSTLRMLQSDEVLFEEGDGGNVAFIIESGVIKISRSRGEGMIILAELERGSIFGEMALIDDGPRSATATASGETVVRQIGKKEFLQHLRDSPESTFKMMQQLVKLIRSLNDKVCMEISIGAEEMRRSRLE